MYKENKTPMSEETYKVTKDGLYNSYLVDVKLLQHEYATSNNPYKEGDIIEDHIGKGQWNGNYHISTRDSDSLPEMVYHCRVLKKDGTPTKKEEYRGIYGSNILIKKQ